MSNIVNISKPFSVTRRHPDGGTTTINASDAADYAAIPREVSGAFLSATDVAAEADRKWFAARPKRKSRVRPAEQDEFSGGGCPLAGRWLLSGIRGLTGCGPDSRWNWRLSGRTAPGWTSWRRTHKLPSSATSRPHEALVSPILTYTSQRI